MKKNKKKFKNLFKYLTAACSKKAVEKDIKFFGNLYQEATEHIFAQIANPEITGFVGVNEKTKYIFTPTDIEYSEGYFVWDLGINSVINFHITELPGWLFGIWWNRVEDKSKDYVRRKDTIKKISYLKDRVECNFFCQWEDEIDKFRPSRSTLCKQYTYFTNWNIDYDGQAIPDAFDWQIYDILEMLVWMRNEPDLAYYRDYTGADLNLKYITRTKAKKFKEKELQWRKDENEAQVKADQLVIEKIISYFDKSASTIIDRGENMFPRYEVAIKESYPMLSRYKKETKRNTLETGFWYWSDLVYYNIVPESLEAEIETYVQELRQENYFKKDHTIYANVTTYGVYAVIDDEFDRLLEGASIINNG